MATKPPTHAERVRLWRALLSNAGASATGIAHVAGVNYSTACRQLNLWVDAGCVRRDGYSSWWPIDRPEDLRGETAWECARPFLERLRFLLDQDEKRLLAELEELHQHRAAVCLMIADEVEVERRGEEECETE